MLSPNQQIVSALVDQKPICIRKLKNKSSSKGNELQDRKIMYSTLFTDDQLLIAQNYEGIK